MSPPQQKPYVPPFSHSLLAGGIAGICEILVMYPTDVVKTRAQLSVGKERIGMINMLTTIVRQEGFTRMYRGILPPIMMEAPKRAVKFAANAKYKPLFTDKQGKLSQLGAIGAGVSAGCTEALIVVPFELIKIRLQDKANVGKYANTVDCLTKVIRNEGILALYKGLESTLWRHATWNGGYFGLIHYINQFFPKAQTDQGRMFYNFIAGALSGTFGTMLNTPFDVVKSRIQNQVTTPGVVPKYNWTLPAMKTIMQEEGVLALYKGFVPKVVRLGPGGGILLVVYEQVSKILKNWDESRKH